MADTRPCRQPVVDFRTGAVLTLHATRLLCEDETEHDGFGEGVANDAMRLGGVVTSQAGESGIPVQCSFVPQNLGSNYQDRRAFSFNRELFRTYVPASAERPHVTHALLTLIEEDWGGLDWDDAVEDIIDGVGGALKSGVGAAVAAAVGAGIGTAIGPLGTAVGTGLGAVAGWVIEAVLEAIKATESDVFPPQETSLAIGTEIRPISFTDHLRFTGHGGRYLLTLEWRLRPLPTRLEKIALQAYNGQFVAAEGGGKLPLIANRPHLRAWETFGLLRRGGDRVALMASNGDFVAAEGGGGRELVANRPHVREWETFRLEELGSDRIALRADNGQYVAAEGGGGRELVANRPRRGPWETFTLHRVA